MLHALGVKSLPSVCFEKAANLGGAFASANEKATMTSSDVLTCFGCYPDTSAPRFYSFEEYVEYLQQVCGEVRPRGIE